MGERKKYKSDEHSVRSDLKLQHASSEPLNRKENHAKRTASFTIQCGHYVNDAF